MVEHWMEARRESGNIEQRRINAEKEAKPKAKGTVWGYPLGQISIQGILFGVSGGGQWVVDTHGGRGIALSGSIKAGLITPGASIGGPFTIANVDRIEGIGGPYKALGISITPAENFHPSVSPGVDVENFCPGSIFDEEESEWVGTTITPNISAGFFPANAYFEQGATIVIPVDIMELIKSVLFFGKM